MLSQVADLVPADQRRRVVVAMSGGVDSSVVAALLKHQGHDVIGITLQLYDHGAAVGRKGSCCAGQDIHDARRVAETIGIPHYVLDYERRFQQSVMAAFADSYIAGETPIPCVTCNQKIKFLDLLDTAAELGADVLATGHYIERRDGPDGPELYRATDGARDQSYFLFATTRDQLQRLWFPLGDLRKPDVREIAREIGLSVAEKSDSQDICFVASGHYTDIVAKLRPNAADPGEIVHVDGRVLGRHAGVMHYTVGQRRGLNLASSEPLYVVRLEADAKRVVVGPRASLRTNVLELKNVNWLGSDSLGTVAREGLAIHARIRSTHTPAAAILVLDEHGDSARVFLPEGEHGVSPGQACVFYTDGAPDARILGGGWIARTHIAADDELTKFNGTLAAAAASSQVEIAQ